MNQFRGKGEVDDDDDDEEKKNRCSHKICSISESKNDPLKEDLTKIFHEHPFSKHRASQLFSKIEREMKIVCLCLYVSVCVCGFFL